MRNNMGIAFAADRHGMEDRRWQYDTGKPKLTVDPDQLPPHLRIIDDFLGGTQWSVPAGSTNQEVLLEFEHHLPYPPMFLCYFFTRDAAALFAANIGQYTLNYGLMRYNALPWSEELYAKVDSKYFRIYHHVDNTIGGGTITAYGSQYKFRIRLEIIARPAVNLGAPTF